MSFHHIQPRNGYSYGLVCRLRIGTVCCYAETERFFRPSDRTRTCDHEFCRLSNPFYRNPCGRKRRTGVYGLYQLSYTGKIQVKAKPCTPIRAICVKRQSEVSVSIDTGNFISTRSRTRTYDPERNRLSNPIQIATLAQGKSKTGICTCSNQLSYPGTKEVR